MINSKFPQQSSEQINLQDKMMNEFLLKLQSMPALLRLVPAILSK
jgi:hypothetical protein